MGLGAFSIAELKSVQKEYPNFQQAFMNLESKLINKCNADWGPSLRFSLASPFGMGDGEYGRTTILPGAFDGRYGDSVITTGTALATFRQSFTSAFLAGNPTQFVLLSGVGSGETIPEGIKIGLMGFAFPNKQQHITELKMQIGDRKFGRINLEEMLIYDTPAVVFDEGLILDEEESFHLYAHMDTVGLTQIGAWTTLYQRVVPIGSLYYQRYNKVGGVVGSAIPTT